MDVIFDIDGTLANATHRLHFITPPLDQFDREKYKPDWDSFLSDEQVTKDAPIQQTFKIMAALLQCNHRIVFVTARNVTTFDYTRDWILTSFEKVNGEPYLCSFPTLPIFMRSENDRRKSDVVKRDLLKLVRANGYNPTLVFEDRKEDTAMWRSEGLLCCQVVEGDY